MSNFFRSATRHGAKVLISLFRQLMISLIFAQHSKGHRLYYFASVDTEVEKAEKMCCEAWKAYYDSNVKIRKAYANVGICASVISIDG